jgi:hypothetical protein
MAGESEEIGCVRMHTAPGWGFFVRDFTVLSDTSVMNGRELAAPEMTTRAGKYN